MPSAESDTATRREEPEPADSRFLATYTSRRVRWEWSHRTWFGRLLLVDDVALALVAFFTLPLEFLLFDVFDDAVDAAVPTVREVADKLPDRYKDGRRPRNDK